MGIARLAAIGAAGTVGTLVGVEYGNLPHRNVHLAIEGHEGADGRFRQVHGDGLRAVIETLAGIGVGSGVLLAGRNLLGGSGARLPVELAGAGIALGTVGNLFGALVEANPLKPGHHVDALVPLPKGWH